jgi:hypothetical protein
MNNNPLLDTVLEILADAPNLMSSTVSIAWDMTKSQENYVRLGSSLQSFNTAPRELFTQESRLRLMALTPVLSREFQRALNQRLHASLGLTPPTAATAHPTSYSNPWVLKHGLELAGDVEMVRKVRTGRIVTVLESVCGPELDAMVGLQLECLRFFKSPTNPFSAENFASALLHALEAAVPHDVQQQSLLHVLVPSYAQALKLAMRHYAPSMSLKVQVFSSEMAQDEGFEPTMPVGL